MYETAAHVYDTNMDLSESFKYDPFGRRIYKSSSSGTSVYAYDGDNVIEETNAVGAVVARYEQGLNIDEPLAMLRSATTSYFEADGLGSVTSLTNTAGTAAQTYTYDSFGNILVSTGSLTNSFRYTGREFDPETSLYYYRARYYDPATGRFLSEDPTGFNGDGTNFYPYVLNSPTSLVDPLGLQHLGAPDYNPGLWNNPPGTAWGSGPQAWNNCYSYAWNKVFPPQPGKQPRPPQPGDGTKKALNPNQKPTCKTVKAGAIANGFKDLATFRRKYRATWCIFVNFLVIA